MASLLRSFFSAARRRVAAHKFLTGAAILILAGGGYWGYGKLTDTSGETRYVLGRAERGTLISTVSGSGQVSPSDQVEVKPRTSGEIVSVSAKEGQHVAAGAVIAYLDSTDAQKAVRDAETSLETARLNLEKLREPVETLTLMQAEDKVTQAQTAKEKAEESLAQDYTDAFTSVSDLFLKLPDIMTGLKSLLFSADRSLGGGGQQNIDFYGTAIIGYDNDLSKGQAYQKDAQAKYDAAKEAFDAAFADYKAASRNADPAAVEKLLDESQEATELIADSLKSATNLIQLYQDRAVESGQTPVALSTTHLSSLSGWTSSVNSQISTLTNAAAGIANDKRSITDAARDIVEAQESLAKTQEGADDLDLRSAQITVQQREDALADAKEALADYVVRAPFAGTIASLDVKRSDSVSAGTTLATLITKQQIAELALNEIDAAKVKTGDKATLTFDAVEDLSLTGSVASVDQVGAVSQGVVSYTVKIALDTQDARVKPGMTVNASVQTDVRQDALLVPASAVKTANGSTYVLAFRPPLEETGSAGGVLADAEPQQVPVTVGVSDDVNTEILSGLAEGDQIVTRTITGSASASSASSAGGSSRAGGFGGGGGPAGGGIRL